MSSSRILNPRGSCVLVTATQLALHYMPKTRHQLEPLKYVVLLGFFGTSNYLGGAFPGAFLFLIMMSFESFMGRTT